MGLGSECSDWFCNLGNLNWTQAISRCIQCENHDYRLTFCLALSPTVPGKSNNLKVIRQSSGCVVVEDQISPHAQAQSAITG